MAGRRKTMLLANSIAMLAAGVLFLSVIISSLPLTIGGLILTGLSYGAMPTLTSVYVSNFYGLKHFALNFSVMNTMLFPASFFAAIAGKMITAAGNYFSVFLMLLCFTIVGMVINLTLKKA
jgi:OFA family oxalate/formate antiporter-like MFS transporter